MSNEGLEAVLPKDRPVDEGERLLHRFSAWVLRQLRRYRRDQERRRRYPIADHEMLDRGRVCTVFSRIDPAAPSSVRRNGFDFVVTTPRSGRLVVAEALAAWLQSEAERLIRARVEIRAREMNLEVRRVSVRDQRTRWGSCSPKKRSLAFNRRLLMAPGEVLDYLIVHELAHLTHANHGRAFWQEVARWSPDHKVHRRWLRDNAWRLRFPPRTLADVGEPQDDLFDTGRLTLHV